MPVSRNKVLQYLNFLVHLIDNKVKLGCPPSGHIPLNFLFPHISNNIPSLRQNMPEPLLPAPLIPFSHLIRARLASQHCLKQMPKAVYHVSMCLFAFFDSLQGCLQGHEQQLDVGAFGDCP